jgi:hypothetical protein
MRGAAWSVAALLCVAAVAPRASASCNVLPSDPLCGSLVTATSSGSGGSTQTFDANPTDPNQFLGPAYTERLANPADPFGEGNIVHDTASGLIAIDQGVMAVEMGADSDAHDYGANVGAGASPRIIYSENVSVQSETVPAGTLVMVYLRYRVAYGSHLFHSLDASKLNYGSESSIVQFQLEGTLDNHFGDSDFDDSIWYTALGVSQNITGIFAAPNPVVELAVPVQVGQTVKIYLYLNCSASAVSNVYYVTPPDQFPTAASAGTAAVVFGVETDTPGVSVVSNLLGGPLPDFANVTQQNAIASALPVTIGGPITTVPEPESTALEVAALLALVATGYVGSQPAPLPSAVRRTS